MWSTESTPITKVDGEIVCSPPDDHSAWEPLGVHDGHVVWRMRQWSADELKHHDQRSQLFSGLLDAFVDQGAEHIQALVEEQTAEASAELQHLRIAALDHEEELAAWRTVQRERTRHYMRGYNACGRKHGDGPVQVELNEENERLWARIRKWEARDGGRPFLQGIA